MQVRNRSIFFDGGFSFFGAAAALVLAVAASRTAMAASDDATPPPFFLQDPSDNLCLAGEQFKRCSIETLWYVVGSPGKKRTNERTSKTEDTKDGT